MEARGLVVSKVRTKKPARRSKRRTTVAAPPASLPPPGVVLDAPTSLVASPAPPEVPEVEGPAINPAKVAKKPFWDVGKDSKAYERCMQILAMRTAGIEDKDIASNLGLSMQTVWNYCYIAGKNGWAETFANAKDQIEFAIMPKVVRELEAGLDDTARHQTSGMQVKTAVALKIAEMTIAKKFGDVGSQQAPNNVIAIRIEMAPGQQAEIRAGSISGTPAYSDGEVEDDGTLAQ